MPSLTSKPPQDDATATSTRKAPHIGVALIPVVVLIAAIYLSVVHYKALGLSTHLPLVLGTIVAAIFAQRLGYSWKAIEKGMIDGIVMALGAILILLVIGMLIGSWIQAGIVPAMVYYGLDLLAPSIFLVATAVIAALVSLATGSSWSTAATVGIALIGVGEGLGIPRPRVAGAVISGAYFGDKMSPLSDTTNLAPAVAGANLFDHIRHMVWTTGPSFVLALIFFGIIGSGSDTAANTTQIDALRTTLSANYWISPWLLIPPLLVIAMVVFRIPALPAITGGWVLGALVAFVAQRQDLGQVLKVSYTGVKSHTGHKLVDGLLSRGGLQSMFSTLTLIIAAMSFGGIMEMSGMLDSLATAVLSLARGDGGLVLATVLTCVGMNALASDQYLAIVVPGRMYRSAYQKRGLAPKNLSRALEDSGTLTSSLFPWNTGGAFMIATLGVKPWSYVPYAFLNLINPLISIFYGFTGLTMVRLSEENPPNEETTSSEDLSSPHSTNKASS